MKNVITVKKCCTEALYKQVSEIVSNSHLNILVCYNFRNHRITIAGDYENLQSLSWCLLNSQFPPLNFVLVIQKAIVYHLEQKLLTI